MPEPLHCPHCGASAVRRTNQVAGAGPPAAAPPAPTAAAGRQDNWKFSLLGMGFALVGLLALGHAILDIVGQEWSDFADTLVPSLGGFCPLGLLGLILLLAVVRDGGRAPAPPGSPGVLAARPGLYMCAGCGARFPGPPDAPSPPGAGRAT